MTTSEEQPFWQKWFPTGCYNVLRCHDPQDEVDDREVIVHMNDPVANAQCEFPSNYIRTAKYTLWSFLPLGLMFQFTKASNVYFLVNMTFSLIPGVAPVSPATAIAPLVFVLVVALVKELIEDIKRHQADDKANSLPTEVMRDGVMVKIPSRDIIAGDILRIYIGDEVRADVLLLSTSVKEGQAFIDTCNLDGETSLKSRKALEATSRLCTQEALAEARVVLHTSPPDPGLLSWAGMIEFDGMEHAVSLSQFLYRGCVLRNTDWVWGMVVFAGVDTKMFRNLKVKPPKSSNLDRNLNSIIIGMFIIQNVCLFTLCSLAVSWNLRHGNDWYLGYFVKKYGSVKLWGYRYLTYFILLSYFIPISLFVTTELCKVIQAQWMRVDVEMMEYMSGVWRHCTPNTSNLNEQLAMVRFIFSDKTGTLTENVMKFKVGDVGGVPVRADNLEAAKEILLDKSQPMHAAMTEYFTALALCNTIQPFKDDSKPNGITHEGSSPDEVALVETAADMGFLIVERTTHTLTLLLDEKQRKTYKILATLEFTPERKMMSIVVEDPTTKNITLYNKGADSFVKPQLSSDPQVQADMARADISLADMSRAGLRTLLVCARDLTPAEFEAWEKKFIAAGKVLQNRGEAVDKVCLEVEQEMRLIGVTAIEDKLQEEVPETLSFFLSAGVVIWMLTGDKRETALTIAATSTLCDPQTDYVDHIDIGSLSPKDPAAIAKVGEHLHVVQQHINMQGTTDEKRCTFVVDGPALSIAMEYYFDLFLDLSQRVNSAVCCRLTPIQKANVVHMFQQSTGLTALAIGDGANDVSMIQEGRVGVGIIGLEGAQAALAADYAIPRFRHLRRLCAVHGRYALLRNASCIMVSFYKNITLAVIQVIFACYAGFSGQTFFDGWLLTFYNIVLTSIQPFFMGIFEKDLPEEALLERPKLFTPLAHGMYFDVRTVMTWLFEGILLGVVLFYVAFPTLQQLDGTPTRNMTGAMVGTTIFCGLVFVVLIQFGLSIKYWQWLQVLGLVVSFLTFWLVVLVYSSIPSVFGASTFYWQMFELMQGGKFWAYLIFYPCLVLMIQVSVTHFKKMLMPSSLDIAAQQHKREYGSL